MPVPPWHKTTTVYEPGVPNADIDLLLQKQIPGDTRTWEDLERDRVDGHGWVLESMPLIYAEVDEPIGVRVVETEDRVDWDGDPASHILVLDRPGGPGYQGVSYSFRLWFEDQDRARFETSDLFEFVPGDDPAAFHGIPVRAHRSVVSNPPWYTPVRDEVVEYEVVTFYAVGYEDLYNPE